MQLYDVVVQHPEGYTTLYVSDVPLCHARKKLTELYKKNPLEFHGSKNPSRAVIVKSHNTSPPILLAAENGTTTEAFTRLEEHAPDKDTFDLFDLR